MKEKDKPKYNALQNYCWMVSLAWKEKEKKILLIEGTALITRIINNLTDLFAVPAILAAVEAKVSIGQLLATILGLVGLMVLSNGATGYLNANGQFGKNTIRGVVTAMLNHKAATTSYPNLYDERFSKPVASALDAVNNGSVATIKVWKNMRELLQFTAVFLVHALLMTHVHPGLFAVVLVISFTSYAVHKRCNLYAFHSRSEVGTVNKQLTYIHTTAQDSRSAKDIRIFGLRPWIQSLNEKAQAAYYALARRHEGAYHWARIADLVLTFLQNGLAYAVLIHMVTQGKLSASEFLLYMTAVGSFSDYVYGVFTSLSEMNRYSLSLNTVRQVLEYPEPFRFDDGVPLAPDPETPYEIRLENVSFRYPGTEDAVLKNIDLTLRPGENIAVVGLNGAGKTTLVHLICGFLDPTEGRILLNGRDIRAFNRRDYYKLFSAVFQQFTVLPGTIAMNVAQSEDHIDMERVKRCIIQVGLQEKIEAEPLGYDTLLERKVYPNAIMLSGGQTQRLMLARALYKDAPIVILDEPTASLDPIAEADMYNKYHEMTAGKSSIYISHRLASTRFCDRILLIEHGVIAEEGTHAQLLERGGRYAELFKIQRGYYQEGDGYREE